MFRKGGILVLMAVCIFLFAGLASAAVITVVQPNGGESLRSDEVYTIKININYPEVPSNVGVAKYKLSYSCKGSDFIVDGNRIWKSITTRFCGLTCPLEYPWEVPNVNIVNNPERDCKVRAVAVGGNGEQVGKDASNDWFVIKPYKGLPVP